VGIVPGQAIRGVNVKAVHRTGGGQVTQTFECGPHQRCSAVSLIHEPEVLRQNVVICRNAILEGR
jgi:hypothetical protein